MSRTWFTSDLHFSHKLVAKLRGFTKEVPVTGLPEGEMAVIGDIEAHDEVIIKNWNRLVQGEDTVWVLGDAGMGQLPRFKGSLARLKGRKHLVTGNHDACWPGDRDGFKHQREWLEVFESIQPFARRKIAGMNVLLSHFPYHLDRTDEPRASQFRLRDEGLPLLHGHLHDKDLRRHGHEIHVGLDAWGLAPVALEQVEELLAEMREREN